MKNEATVASPKRNGSPSKGRSYSASPPKVTPNGDSDALLKGRSDAFLKGKHGHHLLQRPKSAMLFSVAGQQQQQQQPPQQRAEFRSNNRDKYYINNPRLYDPTGLNIPTHTHGNYEYGDDENQRRLQARREADEKASKARVADVLAWRQEGISSGSETEEEEEVQIT
jgi:hypothetical protein